MKGRASRPRRAHLESVYGSWQMSRLMPGVPSFPESVFERRKPARSLEAGASSSRTTGGRAVCGAPVTTTWVVRSAPRDARGRTCDRASGLRVAAGATRPCRGWWTPARRSCPGVGVDSRRQPPGRHPDQITGRIGSSYAGRTGPDERRS